ncbi:hypothetical protein J31TS4_35020 [Paenibacillus sp. J31TS4]|uniref:hypothetical protein n=1 Tax=Paenibacillus sp. J31TS4 TaxID=2807195 RepID=UPI001B0B7CF7|nr:hypothetical protein [Paenibacillus sp. J31TS4]GIP40222.1 hypothetical protein J31TS4_35020 [Paenibacillus sp. J31TS4]
MTYYLRCTEEEEYAQVSLFALKNRHELHRAFGTVDMVTLLYDYMTLGHLLYIADEDRRVIGVTAYYHGTPEADFRDKEVAHAEIAILDRAYRGTRQFLKGLNFLVEEIMKTHPEVQDLRFTAFSENKYLCRLYSKFSKISHTREGLLGEETIFSVNVYQLRTSLDTVYKV